MKKIKLNQKNIFILCLVLVLLTQIIVLSNLHQLPGPIYGGDVYRERGIIQSMINTGKFWEDTYFENNLMFFPYIIYSLFALISSITGLSINFLIIYQVPITTMLASIAFFNLGKLLSKKYALFLPFIFWARNFSLGFKPSISFGIVLLIFSITEVIKIMVSKEDNKIITKRKIIAGILLGLVNLTHFEAMIWNLIFIFSIIIGELIYHKFKKYEIKKLVQKLAIPVIIMGFLSAIFYLPLLIRYKLQSLNPVQQYCMGNFSKGKLFWPLENLFRNLFNQTNVLTILISIIGLVGIVILIMNFKRSIKYRFAIIFFLILVIASGHYLVTRSLLGKYIAPGHIASGCFISVILFQFYGILILIKKFKRKALYPLVFLLIGLIILGTINFTNGKWVQYGMKDDQTIDANLKFGNWLIENTQNKDVFLANDETAFMLNSISGRKVVFARRTHVSSFVNVEKRYADGIGMLYSKDKNKVLELLKMYNVTYFYEDSFLYNHPIIINADMEIYFKKFDIPYNKTKGRLDPSIASSRVYDVLVINPQEVELLKHNITKPVYTVNVNNQIGGRLYELIY